MPVWTLSTTFALSLDKETADWGSIPLQYTVLISTVVSNISS